MRGYHSDDGTVTVSWNSLAEQLSAPDYIGPDGCEKRQWLPCSLCGVLRSVGTNITSVMCLKCDDL